MSKFKKVLISSLSFCMILTAMLAFYKPQEQNVIANNVQKTESNLNIVDVPKDEKPIEKTPVVSTKSDYEIGVLTDYISIFPEDLYKQSDLVVYGTYLGCKDVYLNEQGRITTLGELEVINTIKGGEKDFKKIQVEFYGGQVSLGEYIENHPTLGEKKLGVTPFDPDKFTEEEKAQKNSWICSNRRKRKCYSW